jgi:hypothetical protein
VAQVQEIWNKFNPRERLSTIGAGLIILGWLVGLTSIYGIGSSAISLLGAIAVLVILYLKYSNPAMVWPAPISLIVLAISGVVALLEVLHLVQWLGITGLLGANLVIVALLLSVVGAIIMAWGAWQEYQIVKPAMPNLGSTSTSAPPPQAPSAPPATPVAPPPAAPPAYPPASAPVDDTDEAPPA